MKNRNVLISGASIAGLSTAWWLNHIGYQVTIVELASAPRTNGAAVDLNEATVAITKRMGLYDKFKSYQLGVDRVEYKNSQNETEGTILLTGDTGEQGDEIEIERDKYVQVMMAELENEVEFIFNDTLISLQENNDNIRASFRRSADRMFNLILGCDGAHSTIRKIWFGPESEYAHFLGAYFSISIIPKLIIPQRIMQTFSVPYKTVMLNAYNGKTDIIFFFLAEQEISYDYRDVAGQRQLINSQFKDAGWRTPELLQEVAEEDDFYFDKFCQIKMPSWSKGRVALVGDAAYCPSPASGQGGSLAIQGAAAIADALLKHTENHQAAFAAYEAFLHPYIEEVQQLAAQNLQTNFVLKTKEEIHKRNTEAKLF